MIVAANLTGIIYCSQINRIVFNDLASGTPVVKESVSRLRAQSRYIEIFRTKTDESL